MVDRGEQRFQPDEKGNLPWRVWQQEEARKREIETMKFMREMEEFWEKRKDQDGASFVHWFWARTRRLGIGEEFRAKFEEWKRSRQS